MRRKAICVVTAVGATALAGGAVAGTTLTYETPDGATGMTYSITADRLSMDSPARDSTIIYDVAADRMTTVDHGERTYTVITAETRAQMEKQISDAQRAQMQAMEDSVEHLPPEAREKILAATKSGVSAGQKGLSEGMKTRVNRTGRIETVNGYECEVIRLRVMMGSSEICLASNAEVGMPAEAAAAMKKMSQGMRQLSGSIMRGLGSTMPGGPGLEGVAVRIRSGGETYVLSDLSTGSVDASKFAVPDGYEEQELMTQGE